MKQRFLLPLDGSQLGEHALPWARLLAEKMGAEVELLRSFESLASSYMPADFASPNSMDHDETMVRNELDEYLQSQVLKFPEGMAKSSRQEGDPASVILDRAESGDIKAVVMASHGRGGLGRWLLGSVATKVVRGSRIPVLVINASTDVEEQPKLQKILVPLDGSSVAEEALPCAVELAESFAAEITLYQGVAHTPIGHPQLDAAVNLELQNAKDYLDSVKERYPHLKIRTEAKIAGTNLGILKQSEKCDLVIMSSHGRSGVKRWLLGSVAEKILQAIDRPLMIVYGSPD